MADREQQSRTLIARADDVVGVQTKNLKEVFGNTPVGIYGWVHLPNGDTIALLELFEGADGEERETSPSRWTVRVQDGVLTVSAWTDRQDRHHEKPGAILLLAQGGWTRFTPHVSYLDDDIDEVEEA